MAGDKGLANRLVMPPKMQAQAVKQALLLGCAFPAVLRWTQVGFVISYCLAFSKVQLKLQYTQIDGCLHGADDASVGVLILSKLCCLGTCTYVRRVL